MRLRILGCGTSTGVPIPGCQCAVCKSPDPKNKRSRAAAVLTGAQGQNVLIDAGPDLRAQALQADLRHVDAVLFTHEHADHILGMDDLRGFNFVQRSSIPCYATADTLAKLKQTFGYIFDPPPSYEGGLLAQVSVSLIQHGQPFEAAGITITPIALGHGSATVTGFKSGELAYATDCNSIPPHTVRQLQGIKYLILDGLRYEPHRTHFTIPEAIKASGRLGVQHTILTHMTHSVDYESVNASLPDNVELAYDGMEIEFVGEEKA